MNARLVLTDIDQLARSIRVNGLLQPIVVRPLEGGQYEIVAGNRRFSACKLLKWRKIRCRIIELDDKEAFEVSLVENLQRKTLGVIEEAEAYRDYVEKLGWGGVSALASRIGKSPSHISKRIAMLDLPDDIIERIRSREINPSIAEELLVLKNEREQSRLTELVSRRHLSTRELRKTVASAKEIALEEDTEITLQYDKTLDNLEDYQKRFGKVIAVFRFSLNQLGPIMEGMDEKNWMINEILLHHRNLLHLQIDNLLKQRKTIRRLYGGLAAFSR